MTSYANLFTSNPVLNSIYSRTYVTIIFHESSAVVQTSISITVDICRIGYADPVLGFGLMLSCMVDPTDDGNIHLSIVAAKAPQQHERRTTSRKH